MGKSHKISNKILAKKLNGATEVEYSGGTLRRIAASHEKGPGFLNNNYRRPGHFLGVVVGISAYTGSKCN